MALRLLGCLLLLISVSAAWAYDTETLCGLTYQTPQGKALKLDLYRPQNPNTALPVILAVHGGYWLEGKGDRRQMAPMGVLLASEGFAVLAIDYRLLPEYGFPDQVADVRAALRWAGQNASTYHFDLRRVYLLGVSAGAQLAALVGVDPDADSPAIAGIIDISGPMNLNAPAPSLASKLLLEQYLGGTQEEKPAAYASASPMAHVTQDDPPFLIIHGNEDHTVPFPQAVQMCKALYAAGVPVTFYIMKGVGHTLPPLASDEGRQVTGVLLAFLQRMNKVASGQQVRETALGKPCEASVGKEIQK